MLFWLYAVNNVVLGDSFVVVWWCLWCVGLGEFGGGYAVAMVTLIWFICFVVLIVAFDQCLLFCFGFGCVLVLGLNCWFVD